MSQYYKFNCGVSTFYPAKQNYYSNNALPNIMVVLTNLSTIDLSRYDVITDDYWNLIDPSYLKINGQTPIGWYWCNQSLAYNSDNYKYIATYDSVNPRNLIISADGGSVGPFRWIIIVSCILIDDNINGYPLCAFDYGASITLNDGQSLSVNFSGNKLYTVNHI